MIKAIILDIDGVIVGGKVGFNSPHPHTTVIEALKAIRAKGTLIVLCTGKPYWGVNEIINGAHLNNPHIVDGGAVVIDSIDNIIVEEHVFEKQLAQEILQICIKENIYVEFYTVDDYFIQEDKKSYITDKHSFVLQRDPKTVKDIVGESNQYKITKIFPLGVDEADKERIDAIFTSYKNKVSFTWGVHPVALPMQVGIMTPLNSSKKEAAKAVVKNLNLSFDDVLGIGDSTSDWSFMQFCGYAATLHNGSKEIKELIQTKGEGKHFTSPHVDENGILETFKYFSLP